MRSRLALPTMALEPALLVWAGYERSQRAADGVLAAAVQQRLTTPDALLGWLPRLRPLRRGKRFEQVLLEIAGGAQSVGELDVRRLCREHGLVLPDRQVPRLDAGGRRRFTDCEWRLADGRTLVLEVDGGFHMDVESWESDLARQRDLTLHHVVLVRCTARELRDDRARLARDLVRLGVPHRVVWSGVRSSAP